ncbi:MAG TPA: AI-2E family transporter [Candidatus Paceibacterota bacterium]|nr:AI-2E family transporter [Candidatus Paceibacterota bacterium]
MFEKKPNNLTLSWQSVIRLYLPIILIIVLWYFRSILLIVILAFIIASIFEKPIDYLSLRWKNRWLATLVVYLISLTIFSILIYFSAVIVIRNFDQLSNVLPNWLQEKIETSGIFNYRNFQITGLNLSRATEDLKTLSTQLFNFIKQSVAFFSKIVGGTFTVFLVFLLSFFINTEKNGIEKGIRFLVPWQYEDYAVYLWDKARQKVGNWFFSQILLSLFVGLSVFIVLSILGIKRAEFLGLLAGILDFIPYLGPFIAGIIIVVSTLSQNLISGIVVLIAFIIIQIVEGIISPSLKAKAMKLNPIIIIISLLIGAKMAGAIGVVIILPLAATFVEFLKDLRSGRLQSYLPQRRLL